MLVNGWDWSRDFEVFHRISDILVVALCIFLVVSWYARRLKMRRLAQGLEIFRGIVNASSRGVGWAYLDGRIGYANPALCRMLGVRDSGELIGRDVLQCYPEHLHQRVRDEILPRVLNGESWTGELALKRPDGVCVPTLESIALMHDADGVPRFLGNIYVELTDQKRNEEYLRAALEREKATSLQLEAAMEKLNAASVEALVATKAKDEFLANMSHEIRTPMTAILGFAETLLDPDTPYSTRVDHLHTIRRNGEHLLSLINDLLDLSKIEAGKMAVESIPTQFGQLLAEVASFGRLNSQSRGLRFAIEYANAIPACIHTDPVRLRQILINLVGNAVKFTSNGEVRLVVSHRNEASTMLQIDVEDTGIGMTPEQVARLFQPFMQGDPSMVRRFGGTGLGLAICRRLAEALGGNIELIRSKPGAGSCFRLMIPTGDVTDTPMLTAPLESSSTQHAVERRKAPRLDCRVLLADDGEDNRRLISHILHSAGAEVLVAEDGQQALQRVEAEQVCGRRFDVILMDMQMPVMDGLSATAALRARGYDGTILAFTAHTMESEHRKCREAGCDDCVTKPIDRHLLVELMAYYSRYRRQDQPSHQRVAAACP